jgi:S-adenosylhomocysteine hydrolase
VATLDDILTTQKNGVVAINNFNQTSAYLGGRITSATIPAASGATLIVTGAGRLVNYSITVKGSAAGFIYNASSTNTAAAANALIATTATQEVGVYSVGLHFANGLVVTPGTGQSLNVTYSIDQ